MKTSYQKGFSIAAFFVAIAAFLGFGAHVATNMQATTTVDTAAQASTSTVTIQPTVTILSPKGGETFKTGDSIQIAWQLSGILPGNFIELTLAGHAPVEVRIINSPKSSGSISFVIPAETCGEDACGQVEGRYRVYVTLMRTKSCSEPGMYCQPGDRPSDEVLAQGYSDFFTIISSASNQSASSQSATATSPSIKVISPNGGETWPVGSNQKVNIELKGNQDLLGSFVDVWLSDGDNSSLIKEFSSCYLSGAYTIDVQIPSYIKPGKYKVVATTKNDELLISPTCVRGTITSQPPPLSEISDDSDTFITITQ